MAPTAKEFRSSRAYELRTLASDLLAESIIRDPSPLMSAANALLDQDDESPDWQYSLDGLRFTISVPQKTYPKIPSKQIDIDLSIQASGQWDNNSHDQFTNLVVDICLSAVIEGDEVAICSWHLDRHDLTGGQPAEVHPLYHLQYGGRGMSDGISNYGNTLLLAAPRLVHPPMDAILAVDYILSHYCGEVRQCMLDIPTYHDFVLSSQQRIWFPYVKKLVECWDDSDNAVHELWPSILIHGN